MGYIHKDIKFNLESLESYKEEFNADTHLDLMNIREKSMMVSSIRSKWLMYLFKERENLDKIKRKKTEVLQEKLISNNLDVSVLKLKREESIAKNSEVIKKLNELETNTKTCIEYIEYAMNILNDFGFQIKNTIDYLKLEKL